MAGNIKGITIEIGGDTTKLDKALSGVNRETRSLQNELKQVNNLLKLDPKNTELVAQKQKILSSAIGETKNKLDVLKQAEAQVQAQFEKGEVSEEQYRALQREIAATEQELKDLETQAKQSGVSLERVGTAFENIGGKAEAAGKALMPVTAAIGGIGAASTKAAVDFEDAMAKVSTIADTTEVPLEDLEGAIMELSDETGIAAEDIADNVYNAISAGQKTGDAVNFVEKATRLAKAGFTDSGAALDILTTAMNAYGMEADEVTNVSDLLIQTQNLGKTTVNELASAMGKVIPTANANNVQMDQLCASYAVLTSNGIATAESTTYLNSMLNELGKGGTKVDTILREQTGKSFSELSEEGMTLSEILAIVDEEAQAQGKSFSDMWSSSEAAKAGIVLLGDSADEFNGVLDQMQNSTGATDAAFGKLDTTSNQAKIALNQIKNSGIELGQTILTMVAPMIETVTTKIKDATTWFNNLDEGQKKTIVTVAAVIASIGPALIMFGKLSTGIGGVIKTVGPLVTKIGGLKGVLAALTGPVGIVIAVIAALVAGFVTLYKSSDEFKAKVDGTFGKLKEAFSQMWQNIQPLLESLKKAFKDLLVALQPVFEFIMTYISSIVNGIINAAAPVISAIQNVVQFVTNIINALVSLLKGDFSGFFSYIGQALQNVVEFVKNILNAWVNFIVGFFEGFGVDIKQIFSDIWTGICNIFSGVGQWFADRFNEAYTNITNIFSTIGQWFSARWTDIKNAFSTAASWFGTQFQNAWTNIKNAFSNVGQFFSDLWTTIKNCFVDVGTKIGNAVGDAFKSAINSCLTTIENIVNKFIGMINGVIGVINEIPGVSLGTIATISLPRLAKGGSLRSGAAIVAEAGPELISVMNGKTVVTPLTDNAKNTALEGAGAGKRGDFVQNNYYTSPKALSPAECARQTRNATRNMVLQLQGG